MNRLPTFSDVTNGRHFDELDAQDAETIRYGCADSDFALRLYHIFNSWFDRFSAETSVPCGRNRITCSGVLRADEIQRRACECRFDESASAGGRGANGTYPQ